MNVQLIYTSAVKGLHSGARGFCTVAASPGMPPPLTARLEQLSTYSFAFNLSDSRARLNPVAFSHLRLRVGSMTHSVLSRIGPAEPDYSGRSNFVAHHILLDRSEAPPGGPARVLSEPGLLVDKWTGPPRELEPQPLPADDAPPGPCHRWQQRTGDARWGGVLSEAMRDDHGPPVYVIYEPGDELLPLFQESLAILPPEERWSITFSTYFMGVAPDVDCQCRGVLAGTAEAARIPPRSRVIDLTRPLGEPPVGDVVQAARAGRLIAGTPPPAPGPPDSGQPQKQKTVATAAASSPERGTYAIDDGSDAVGAPASPRPPARPLTSPPIAADRERQTQLPLLLSIVVPLIAIIAGVTIGLNFLDDLTGKGNDLASKAPADGAPPPEPPNSPDTDGGGDDTPRADDTAAATSEAGGGGDKQPTTEDDRGSAMISFLVDPLRQMPSKPPKRADEAVRQAGEEPDWTPAELAEVDAPPEDLTITAANSHPLTADKPVVIEADLDSYYWDEPKSTGFTRVQEGATLTLEWATRNVGEYERVARIATARAGKQFRAKWKSGWEGDRLPRTIVFLFAKDGDTHVLYYLPDEARGDAGTASVRLHGPPVRLSGSDSIGKESDLAASFTDSQRRPSGAGDEDTMVLPLKRASAELIVSREPRKSGGETYEIRLNHDVLDGHREAYDSARSQLKGQPSLQKLDERIETQKERPDDAEGRDQALTQLEDMRRTRERTEEAFREAAAAYNAEAARIEKALQQAGRVVLLDRLGIPLKDGTFEIELRDFDALPTELPDDEEDD